MSTHKQSNKRRRIDEDTNHNSDNNNNCNDNSNHNINCLTYTASNSNNNNNNPNWSEIALTSGMIIFQFIQPKLLFGFVNRVCKSWNNIISSNAFIYGYFKETMKKDISKHCDYHTLNGLTTNILKQY